MEGKERMNNMALVEACSKMTRETMIKNIKEKLKEDNTPEKRKERMVDFFNKLQPFKSIDNIPDIPITDEDTYNNVIIPNLIRCGAIPKDNLIKGKTYLGSCRNASEAVWMGNQFEYIRHKFGTTYKETINHFQDDDGSDLFVPLYIKEQ